MALAKIRFLFFNMGAPFSAEARLVGGLKYHTPGACLGHKHGVWFDLVWLVLSASFSITSKIDASARSLVRIY